MPLDIPRPVVGIATLWATTFLYGELPKSLIKPVNFIRPTAYPHRNQVSAMRSRELTCNTRQTLQHRSFCSLPFRTFEETHSQRSTPMASIKFVGHSVFWVISALTQDPSRWYLAAIRPLHRTHFYDVNCRGSSHVACSHYTCSTYSGMALTPGDIH